MILSNMKYGSSDMIRVPSLSLLGLLCVTQFLMRNIRNQRIPLQQTGQVYIWRC